MTVMSDSMGAPTRWEKVRSLAVRAFVMEMRVYTSLFRAAARRPLLSAGAQGFRYSRPVLTILIIFIVLSAIEIPIVDAIVHRLFPLRVFFLVLGIWGVTWMIGLLCAYFTRPHEVGPWGIRVREGLELDLGAPWDDIASVGISEHRDPRVSGEEKAPRIFEEEGRRVMAIRIANETNIEIAFERPLGLTLPGLAPKGGTHTVDVLRFWVDDPAAFIRAVRTHLG